MVRGLRFGVGCVTTQRLHSSSFLGLIYMSPKKELTMEPMGIVIINPQEWQA